VSPVYKFSNVGGFLTKNLYTSALAGNTAVVNDKGSMYPLGVFTLASAQATIEFTNIPQTYTHLEIRGLSKNTAGSGYILVEYNGDTSTSKYTWMEQALERALLQLELFLVIQSRKHKVEEQVYLVQ